MAKERDMGDLPEAALSTPNIAPVVPRRNWQDFEDSQNPFLGGDCNYAAYATNASGVGRESRPTPTYGYPSDALTKAKSAFDQMET